MTVYPEQSQADQLGELHDRLRAATESLESLLFAIGSKATPTAADRFAAIMWGYFVDGCSVDGADLQEALLESGMAFRRPCTAEEADAMEFDCYEGDEATFLTEAGKAHVNAARAANKSGSKA